MAQFLGNNQEEQSYASWRQLSSFQELGKEEMGSDWLMDMVFYLGGVKNVWKEIVVMATGNCEDAYYLGMYTLK